MRAVATWVRFDVRTRLRSLVVLALLVALSTSVVLTAMAGARRGASAIDRLLDKTLPATLAVLPNEPGFDWDAVAELPGVEAIGRFPITAYEVEGLPPDSGADFAYLDDAVMRDIERPVVLEGRLADPSRDDEVVATAGFEGLYGKGVGDSVTIRLYGPEQVDEVFVSGDGGRPEGPSIDARIVGVVRSPWFSDKEGASARIIPSVGLFAQHEANLLGTSGVIFVNALVRLEGGAGAVPAFRERLAEVSGRRDIEFFALAEDAQHLRDVTGFEARALLAFALAAVLAAVFLVGQSVARLVSGAAQDLRVLSSMGMSPGHVRLAAAIAPTAASVAGALLGVAVALTASPWFPTGTAAPYEPAPGRDVDVVVLVLGFLVVPSLVAGGALLFSSAASSAAIDRSAQRGSAVAAWAARRGAPVPLVVGCRLALEPGRGAQAVPVRPALIGAVVGALGVVAALTFADGVNDAAEHPERFGQVSELKAFLGFNGDDFIPVDEVLPVLAADPDVFAVNDSRQSVVEAGAVDIPVFTLAPVSTPPAIVLSEGAVPDSPRDVTLASGTASALGVGVGDEVRLVGSRAARSFVVRGIGFVPEGAHNSYDTGAWMTAAGYDSVIDGFKFHSADVALRRGADLDVVSTRLGSAVAAAIGSPEAATQLLSPRPPPSRLAELRQIERLPLLLAAFLALLAVAAVGHALAVAAQRRRHDLAVLRALGVTRWQSRVTILTQATVLAMVGILFGAPLGFALGRFLWRSVATTTPIAHVPPLAVWTLVLAAPIGILIANLLAALPSHRAATMRLGEVLRTE